MKNKITNRILLFVLLTSVIFTSCQDDDKTVFTIHTESDNTAPHVRIVSSTPVIDITKLETTGYSGTVSTLSDNVASWSVSVKRISAGVTSDTIPLKTISSFPSEFSVTGAEIANALGIATTDLLPGDNIQFVATAVGTNGTNISFETLGGDLAGQPEQRQAFNFGAFISCPFIAADMAGTYNVVRHRFDAFFGAQPATRIIEAGPGPNQFTIKGGAVPLDGADDLIVDVDPDTGIVIGAGNPDDIHFNTFGPGSYGTVKGFAFSCVGFTDLTITSPGFIDNYFILEK